MNDNETFTPETIEEQIERHIFSPSPLPPSSNARLIQELEAYYEEDQHSMARMWKRLVQHAQMANLETVPDVEERQNIGDIVMQKMPDSAEIREDAGQMGASLTPVRRRISRRALVTSLGVGAAALGTAASYVFFSSRLLTPQSSSQAGAFTLSPMPKPSATATEPPASGKLGDILSIYRGQHLQVTDARWSPDGSLVASASYDRTVQIWQAANGKLVFTYNKHTDEVNSVDWSPDGQWLVSGGGNISDNVTNRNGHITGHADYSVQIWNMSAGLVRRLSGPTDYIRPIRWSPDGRYIAAACYNKKAYVWEAATGHLVQIYTGHQTILTGLAWSPDSKHIVTSGSNAEVQIWEATTGKFVLSYPGYQPDALVLAVAWSPDGTRIASGTAGDALVNVWEANTGRTLFVYTGHAPTALSTGFPGRGALSASLPFSPAYPASGSGVGVFAVAWSPDSTTVASGGGSGDGSVQIWKPATHEKVYTFPGNNGGNIINTLAWSPSGAHLASASDNVTTTWQSKA